uniref:Uncharacterized protein n=1 Tax=Anguilla anguilla TaxID=7936 RepID=A0A0E9WD22_ANGAN
MIFQISILCQSTSTAGHL